MFFTKKDKKIEVYKELQEKSTSHLDKISKLKENELLIEFDSSRDGIDTLEALERIEKYGTNEIKIEKKSNRITRLVDSFINPFNIVLFIVALITFITDIVLENSGDYITISIILFLILVSSLTAFIQGEKSNDAAEKLSNLVHSNINVIRNASAEEIDMKEIVIGDLIHLSAGDIIPGDVRFLTTKDMFIAQSALTGESTPVEKFSYLKDAEPAETITDLYNIGFMGSNVISGTALAIVVACGNDSYMASMAQSIGDDSNKNSFEKGIESISKLLIKFMLIMVPIILLINGFTKGDWGGSVLFALTIAVGLTPEMLPMIMTATLAKGAVSMSKHQTIVKDLSAIQTFGEMNILCTDKTGTLTEDKIILEKYMDVEGNDNLRVLRYAYFNSYYQTGLKNLLDLAVISRANTKDKVKNLIHDYELVDEIPFDFNRRRMSVVLQRDDGKTQLITKGAVEELIENCKYIELDGEVQELDENQKTIAMETYQKHNADGLRIIAVAKKNDIPISHTFGRDDEVDLTLIGFIGFLDPPKESAKLAIKALKNHGVRTVVLTGDSEGVAIKVCKKVGVKTELVYLGVDVDYMTDDELKEAISACDLFAKLSPNQKRRIIKSFQASGDTVGYLGDGINDAPALKQSDVGISVDSAVDIAKETANIILLKKDLMVLEEGVIEGRKNFANINKYIKMTTSGNFGNMFSVMLASLLLPFLPMLPVQILVQNLLNDFSQLGLPFDNVDEEYLKEPKKWSADGIKRFMLYMGPLSSLFDILCFLVLFYVIGANTVEQSSLFQAGWFIFGTLSQVIVVHIMRTRKIPFIQSNSSIGLFISTIIVCILAVIIGFTDIAIWFDMTKMTLAFVPWLALLIILYCISIQIIKSFFLKKFNEWI